jgi:hypothetical protein
MKYIRRNVFKKITELQQLILAKKINETNFTLNVKLDLTQVVIH